MQRHERAKRVARRRFLGTAGVLAAAPWVIPSTAWGNLAPSNRITIGLIGCGLHGTTWNLPQLFRCDDARVVAVCDVDRIRLKGAKVKVDRHYGEAAAGPGKGCRAYDDFRELINRPDIDAIANCTPDHWHVIPAIMAARAGKLLEEGRRVVALDLSDQGEMVLKRNMLLVPILSNQELVGTAPIAERLSADIPLLWAHLELGEVPLLLQYPTKLALRLKLVG